MERIGLKGLKLAQADLDRGALDAPHLQRIYTDGKTIALEHRFPNEQPERFVSLAAELAALKPDVLIAVTQQAAVAAQRATTTIPIVFIVVPDPVGVKLVDSLSRPGGNITGLTRRWKCEPLQTSTKLSTGSLTDVWRAWPCPLIRYSIKAVR